jgi:hypothetical protein
MLKFKVNVELMIEEMNEEPRPRFVRAGEIVKGKVSSRGKYTSVLSMDGGEVYGVENTAFENA